MIIQNIEDESYPQSPPMRKTRYNRKLLRQSTTDTTELNTSLQITECRRQCRICLDSEESGNDLLSPCKCTGTVRYIHQKCFKKWVDRQFETRNHRQKIQMLKRGAECEICKFKVHISFKQKYHCNSKDEFEVKYRLNPIAFYLFILFLVINFGSTSYLIQYIVSNPLDIKNHTLFAAVIICCFCFLVPTGILAIYQFNRGYLMSKKWGFDSIKNMEESLVNLRQIFPQVIQEQQ